MADAAAPAFGVRFDDAAFREDLAHATEAGRRTAHLARARMERDGVPVTELRRCQAEVRDGTLLEGCVKTYLPSADGPWGMVFSYDFEGRKPVLVYLAFGARHPTRPWQPSVYDVAHRRLHPGT